jgi:hypothetical protein
MSEIAEPETPAEPPAQPSIRRERPETVTIAAVLWWITLAMSVAATLVMAAANPQLSDLAWGTFIASIVMGAVVFHMFNGGRWARIILAVLIAVGTAFELLAAPLNWSGFLITALEITATILTFTASANEWFQPRGANR